MSSPLFSQSCSFPNSFSTVVAITDVFPFKHFSCLYKLHLVAITQDMHVFHFSLIGNSYSAVVRQSRHYSYLELPPFSAQCMAETGSQGSQY